MSTTGGPRLEGIGRSGDSDIVLCMDARDMGSYMGEPTTNELYAPLTDTSQVTSGLTSFPIAPTVAYSNRTLRLEGPRTLCRRF